MEDKIIFTKWLESMGWDKHGGKGLAAKALGKDPKTIKRYLAGSTNLSIETRLAMTALAQNLKPWNPKSEGLPAIHASISFGKE